jgi:hypothetical protein
MERQFLLMWRVTGIRASDLERIPREGSLSTDPRDLPAPGVKPIVKQLSRERLLATTMFAAPGILGSEPSSGASFGGVVATGPTELACKPLKVVNGRDVVDVSGQWMDITSLLSGSSKGGLFGAAQSQQLGASDAKKETDKFMRYLRYSAGAIIGIAIANTIASLLWSSAFDRTEAFGQSNELKYAFYIILFFTIMAGSDAIDQIIVGFQQNGAGFYTQVMGCIFPSA